MNKLDKIRTIVRDMLLGRTRIKIMDPVDPSRDVVPVFLVGSFRSGTTLFRYLLDSHSAICCPPETKYLTHFAEMRAKESTGKAFDDMGFDEAFIRQQVLRFSNSLYGTYMASRDARLVVDKTPEYTRVLDYLDWLYEGRCRYLLIFRNGLDVTHSMLSVSIEPLEGNKTIDTAFEYWKEDTGHMLRWLHRHPDRCRKVIYDDLCDDTENVLKGVMEFMGQSFEPGQLRWYEKDHTQGAEDFKARRQRSIRKSVHTYVDWPDDVISDLKARAADVHRAAGFNPETLKPLEPAGKMVK